MCETVLSNRYRASAVLRSPISGEIYALVFFVKQMVFFNQAPQASTEGPLIASGISILLG